MHWEGRQKLHCRCTRESPVVPILAGPGWMPTSRGLRVGCVTKATCDVLLGSVPDRCAWGRGLHSCLWHFCSRPYGKAYSFSLSSLVAGIRHPGPDSLANDGRSGTRWIASLWPLVPLTPCCLFVLCGGYNMVFYSEQILFECSVPSSVIWWCDLRILCTTLRNVCF